MKAITVFAMFMCFLTVLLMLIGCIFTFRGNVLEAIVSFTLMIAFYYVAYMAFSHKPK
jgi:hypothetical protein